MFPREGEEVDDENEEHSGDDEGEGEEKGQDDQGACGTLAEKVKKRV